jgi:hypothetical protein
VVEFTFSASSNSRRVLTLLQLVREHRLALPDDPELIEELVALRLVETSPGVYRHDHDPGRHDDLATAVSLVAQHLVDRPAGGWAELYRYSCEACGEKFPVGSPRCPSCGTPPPAVMAPDPSEPVTSWAQHFALSRSSKRERSWFGSTTSAEGGARLATGGVLVDPRPGRVGCGCGNTRAEHPDDGPCADPECGCQGFTPR